MTREQLDDIAKMRAYLKTQPRHKKDVLMLLLQEDAGMMPEGSAEKVTMVADAGVRMARAGKEIVDVLEGWGWGRYFTPGNRR